jgi:glycosyltransferase involved in cell wall biosynthesis
MRVAFNASTTIGNKTGIGRYAAELVRCLDEIMAPGELFAYPHGWVRALRAKWKENTAAPPPAPGGPRRWRLPSLRRTAAGVLRPVGHAVLWGYNKAVLRRGKFDLYHEPNYVPVPCDVPTVVTLHDLSIVHHPEWHPPERLAFFDKHLPRALRQAQHFFSVTEFSRREIAATLNIPLAKITNTYNGVRPDLAPLPEEEVRPVLRQLGLPERYLLHLGTVEPRKNLLMLMRAYVDLPAALRERYPLVLAGAWGWKYEAAAEFFHAVGKHKGVVRPGFLPDEALPAVYNGARALVLPTLYEGFGIPAVEMMGCGGAVLASTAGAVAEVVGDRAALIPPDDEAGWRDAMLRVLSDDDWWAGLRRGTVERARRFTWENTAATTLRVYRQLLGEQEEIAPARAA